MSLTLWRNKASSRITSSNLRKMRAGGASQSVASNAFFTVNTLRYELNCEPSGTPAGKAAIFYSGCESLAELVSYTGTVTLDTTNKLFGSACFDIADNNSYGQLFSMNGPNIGGRDWTLEYRYRTSNASVGGLTFFNGIGGLSIYTTTWGGNLSQRIDGTLGGAGYVFWNANNPILLTTYANDTWHTLAFCREGNKLYFLFDGNIVRSDVTDSPYNILTPSEAFDFTDVMLGHGTGAGVVGKFDEIILYDYAKYTSNYTPATTAYTVPVDVPGFTITGSPATFSITVAANNPTIVPFLITGSSATLLCSRNLNLNTGSCAVTGFSANTTISRNLTLATGTFVLTGSNSTLISNRNLSLGSSSLDISGFNSTLEFLRYLQANPSTLDITGFSVTLEIVRNLDLNSGSISLTGFDSSLVANYKLVALGATPIDTSNLFEYCSFDSNISDLKGHSTSSGGSIDTAIKKFGAGSLTPFSFNTGLTSDADSPVYYHGGITFEWQLATTSNPISGSTTILGVPIDRRFSIVVNSGTLYFFRWYASQVILGTMPANWNDGAFHAHAFVLSNTTAYYFVDGTLVGSNYYGAGVDFNYDGAYLAALSGNLDELIITKGAKYTANYTPATESLLSAGKDFKITGSSASLTKSIIPLVASEGSYSIIGYDADLSTTTTSIQYNLIAGVESYVITGIVAYPQVGRNLVLDYNSYVVTGFDITTIAGGKLLVAATGTYSLTGSDLELLKQYAPLFLSGTYVIAGINIYNPFPDPANVLLDVIYGDSMQYTGTLVPTSGVDSTIKYDVISGKFVKILSNKLVISL